MFCISNLVVCHRNVPAPPYHRTTVPLVILSMAVLSLFISYLLSFRWQILILFRLPLWRLRHNFHPKHWPPATYTPGVITQKLALHNYKLALRNYKLALCNYKLEIFCSSDFQNELFSCSWWIKSCYYLAIIRVEEPDAPPVKPVQPISSFCFTTALYMKMAVVLLLIVLTKTCMQ
jgi:hypothetical protein